MSNPATVPSARTGPSLDVAKKILEASWRSAGATGSGLSVQQIATMGDGVLRWHISMSVGEIQDQLEEYAKKHPNNTP